VRDVRFLLKQFNETSQLEPEEERRLQLYVQVRIMEELVHLCDASQAIMAHFGIASPSPVAPDPILFEIRDDEAAEE
jgi:hypothetical protein